MSIMLLPAPGVFAQQAGQDPRAMDRFHNAHPAGSQASVAEPVSDPFTEALVRDLTASGFQVSQGVPKLYTLQDCIDRTCPAFKNCFQANPAAPYVVPVVKTWPDEYVDPAMVNAFVETDPGYSVTYRLDLREAIVIYGLMPPPGRYMGLQTWEFSEHGTWKPKDYYQWADTPDLPFPMQYLFDTIPPGGMENCSPTDVIQPAIGDPALRGKLIIALRYYIAQGTQRGPDASKLLTPRILTFSRL